MRAIVVALTTVLTVGFAAAVLTLGSTPSAFAQATKTSKEKMAEMKAKDAASFDACLTLARQRGFPIANDEYDTSVVMFVDGCMAGKQH
jgi:hypothetical protein